MRKTVGYARIAVTSVALTGAALVGGAAPGCRTATQVTVELRTSGDLTCEKLRGVAIVVARGPVEAEDKMRLQSFSAEIPRGVCGADPKLLGTLVVTPSEGAGAIIVRARISDDPTATCEPPNYRGCIVSRRSFTFIEHAAVTLPITLESACLDLPCDAVTSCRSGECVSSKAECSESSGSCESLAEPAVSPDGGPAGEGGPVDARGDGQNDAASDGATDGAKDAPPDGPPHGMVYGNDCPLSPPQRCAGSLPVCCFQMFWTCSMPGVSPMPGACIGVQIPCNGRLDCGGNSYCCGPKQPAGSASPLAPSCTTDVPGCKANGEFVCTTHDDCPDGMWCTGIRFQPASPPGQSPMKKCTPTPP